MSSQKPINSSDERSTTPSTGSLIATADAGICLDTAQLECLEQSFRAWVAAANRRDVQHSRRRIFLIFLLIRQTGAKLSEVLALNPHSDITAQTLCIRHSEGAEPGCQRSIAISESLAKEIQQALAEPDFSRALTNLFAVDPAFVRRKFYERAETCGIAKHMAGPEMIRRARAVELMQSNMPLPAVQKLLGHSSPNLTTAHLSYSEEELQRVTRYHLEREACRRTSARNSFYGKISTIKRGDVQALVTLITPAGHSVTTIITLESLDRLGLQVGRLVTAEVKAPWVMLQPFHSQGCTADNHFQGTVVRINIGKVTAEYVVRIDESTELCAMVSRDGAGNLSLQVGDPAWVLFNCFAVILHD